MRDANINLRSESRWSRYLALAALAAIAIIWGYNWVVTKVALRYIDPFVFSAMRTFLGAVSLFVVIILLKRPIRPKALALTAPLGLLQTTGSIGLTVWALKYAGVSKASVLVFIMPFWLLLLAWIILGERLRGLQWLAIFIAFGGLVFVLSPWKFRGGILGDMIAIGSGFAWAAGVVVAKLLHNRHEVDILSLTAWQMFLGSLPLVLVAALTTSRSPVWSGSLIAALLYNILLVGALGWYLWLFVLRVLPAGLAGIGSLATPVIGAGSAWLQLGERPGVWEGLGILLIIAALALLTGRELVGRRQSGRPELV